MRRRRNLRRPYKKGRQRDDFVHGHRTEAKRLGVQSAVRRPLTESRSGGFGRHLEDEPILRYRSKTANGVPKQNGERTSTGQ